MNDRRGDSSNKLLVILIITKTLILLFILSNLFIKYNEVIIKSEIKMNIYSYIHSTAFLAFILILSYLLGYTFYKRENNPHLNNMKPVFRWTIDNILFISMISFCEYICSANENQCKYIFILLILVCTIQYGSKYGIITALISSANLLVFDLIIFSNIDGINIVFQNDLIIAGVFVILAWILGYYVDIVTEINKQQVKQLGKLNTSLKEKEKEQNEMKHIIINNEQCYNMLFENSLNMIVVHDNCEVMYCNKKAQSIFGYTTREYKSIYDFYEEEKKNSLQKKYLEMIEKKLIKMMEEENIIDIQGNIIPVRNTSSYFIYKNKPAILTILVDISNEKKIEKLENLIQKNNMLLNKCKESNKRIRMLFNNISHELKTPLNVMYAAIQAMNIDLEKYKDIFQGKEKKYLNVMKQNCLRMNRLVENFIDINKLDSNNIFINKKNGNIVETVENIVQTVAEYVSSDVTLLFDTNVEEKIMAYDKNYVERIMLNLLSNSIKYSDDLPYIYINLIDYGNQVEISVIDYGRGIPKEKMIDIFEIFGQADTSLCRECEGVGLGLYIVKKLVELHDGNIEIVSDEGDGCEVKIYLPSTYINNEEYITGIMDETYEEKIEREFSDIYTIG